MNIRDIVPNMTEGEQQEVVYYWKSRLLGIDIDLNVLPKWLLDLEIIRRKYIIAEHLLSKFVALTHFTSVDKYPMELREEIEDFLKSGGEE
jgi:hypothetical protein